MFCLEGAIMVSGFWGYSFHCCYNPVLYHLKANTFITIIIFRQIWSQPVQIPLCGVSVYCPSYVFGKHYSSRFLARKSNSWYLFICFWSATVLSLAQFANENARHFRKVFCSWIRRHVISQWQSKLPCPLFFFSLGIARVKYMLLFFSQ